MQKHSTPPSLSQIRWKLIFSPNWADFGPLCLPLGVKKCKNLDFRIPNLHVVQKRSSPPSLSQIIWKLIFGFIWEDFRPLCSLYRSKNVTIRKLGFPNFHAVQKRSSSPSLSQIQWKLIFSPINGFFVPLCRGSKNVKKSFQPRELIFCMRGYVCTASTTCHSVLGNST